MKNRLFLLGLFLVIVLGDISAQSYSFENGVITPFKIISGSGTLSTVNAPYKDGSNSLCWSWTAAATVLQVDAAVSVNNGRDGVSFWVYNESPSTQPMRCEYRTSSGIVAFYFDFGLNFTGWRICRIGTAYMSGSKSVKTGLIFHITTPSGLASGRLFIDRFSFLADCGGTNAPDMQQPANNDPTLVDLYEYASLWNWESTLKYDIPLKTTLTSAQQSSLTGFVTGVQKQMPSKAYAATVDLAKQYFSSAGIMRKGNFIVGKPMVTIPDSTANDFIWLQVGQMLLGYAEDYLYNGVASSRDTFLLIWDYTVDQGFDYGSSMGDNHHCGYNTRELFNALFLMRSELKTAGKLSKAEKIMDYWSGLPETRVVFNPQSMSNMGLLDNWNTWNLSRAVAVAIKDNDFERYRAMESYVRWQGGSWLPSSGNMGGIKLDGSLFHHGGFYPGYAIGGLGGVSLFCDILRNTQFAMGLSARKSLANALVGMASYSNAQEWTLGIAGRNVFTGSMVNSVVDCVGYLSLMGGISDSTATYDKQLASYYMNLPTNSNSATLHSEITAKTGLTVGTDIQGFRAFNHGALGTLRYGSSLVTIKGYNSSVWGSEIYTSNNRYGRYQSYGAVEILNGGSPVTRVGSRLTQNGWDWNRIPGTTTIHLPNTLLNSPITTTNMTSSYETFAGASSLDGVYGIFGMKLWEKSDVVNTNYTPDFKARKSVFAFGKRLICLGSNITNTNANYATETTLFQNSLLSKTEQIKVDGVLTTAFGLNQTITKLSAGIISDMLGNYYRIAPNMNIKILGSTQQSNNNTDMAPNSGDFVTAWLDHGTKPLNGAYEYMIMLKPTDTEISSWSVDPGYTVIQCDSLAHILKDKSSNTTGYVCFRDITVNSGKLLSASAETLVMLSEVDANNLHLSVCDPSLHLPSFKYGYTLMTCPVTTRHLVIAGIWQLETNNSLINLTYSAGNTVLDVTCQFGLPIYFNLKNNIATVPDNIRNDSFPIVIKHKQIEVTEDVKIAIYNSIGVQVLNRDMKKGETFILTSGIYLITSKTHTSVNSRKTLIS